MALHVEVAAPATPPLRWRVCPYLPCAPGTPPTTKFEGRRGPLPAWLDERVAKVYFTLQVSQRGPVRARPPCVHARRCPRVQAAAVRAPRSREGEMGRELEAGSRIMVAVSVNPGRASDSALKVLTLQPGIPQAALREAVAALRSAAAMERPRSSAGGGDSPAAAGAAGDEALLRWDQAKHDATAILNAGAMCSW